MKNHDLTIMTQDAVIWQYNICCPNCCPAQLFISVLWKTQYIRLLRYVYLRYVYLWFAYHFFTNFYGSFYKFFDKYFLRIFLTNFFDFFDEFFRWIFFDKIFRRIFRQIPIFQSLRALGSEYLRSCFSKIQNFIWERIVAGGING